mmetsp:Transcript_3650/g.8685  ORF Transcript_3650/g.8685 Transcript_3650/m.8685 type:complete len:89 (+) Transcript_3650:814-1080(+)
MWSKVFKIYKESGDGTIRPLPRAPTISKQLSCNETMACYGNITRGKTVRHHGHLLVATDILIHMVILDTVVTRNVNEMVAGVPNSADC